MEHRLKIGLAMRGSEGLARGKDKESMAKETKSRRLKRESENGRVTENEELGKEGPELEKFSVGGQGEKI